MICSDDFNLNYFWEELVVSATILAAWMFSMLAGSLTNNFGRKIVILLASVVFTIGALIMAFARTAVELLIGRFVVGIAIGLASMAIPIYIAEVAPVSIRGKLVTINTCFVTFGQFVASVLAGVFSKNEKTGWRWMLGLFANYPVVVLINFILGLAAVPSIIQMVLFLFMPESPRWLIQKKRYDDAHAALVRCRQRDNSPQEIDKEFEGIKQSCISSQEERADPGFLCVFKCPNVRRALLLGCLLQMFQQLAGINTVMYYSATIIQMSGVSDKSLAVWLACATSSINFIFSFVGLFLVERIGRRPLTLSSLFGVVVALVVLGLGFQMASIHSPAVTFHVPSEMANKCGQATTCSQCISSDTCGFCFYSNEKGLMSAVNPLANITGSNSVNGTCLVFDKHNPDISSSES